MKISKERKQNLENAYQYYLLHPALLRMKDIPVHLGSNCYLHTFRVTKEIMKKAVKSSRNLDLENLLLAGIFHDYYLYNWREHRHTHHATMHPFRAIENARRDFNLPDEAAKMIRSHMWPFNFNLFPKSKEARILCNVDTWVALKECLVSKKAKKKNEEKYLRYISSLFD